MDDSTEAVIVTCEAPAPSPGATLRPGATGIPVLLGDGREWLFAHGGVTPAFDDLRDRIFDAAIVQGEYDAGDQSWIAVAATKLLMACHAIDFEAAFSLVACVPMRTLIDGVEAALIGDAGGDLTYSEWMRISLIVNGIRPGDVPTAMIPKLLGELAAQGKTPAKTRIAAVKMAGRKAMRAAFLKPPAPPAEGS